MTWESLRPVLAELADRQPSPLLVYPNPRVIGVRRAPFRIRLAPWATGVAEELRKEFGREITLCVGSLAYPSGEWVDANWHTVPGSSGVDRDPYRTHVEPADPLEIYAEPVQDLFVRSGHELAGELILTNRSARPVDILTPGRRHPVVVDPASGHLAGGDPSGAAGDAPTHLSLGPQRSVTMPLRVGTASYHRSLGWAIPGGAWAVRVTLDLTSGKLVQLPLLPLTII